jgi:hypothetical protein
MLLQALFPPFRLLFYAKRINLPQAAVQQNRFA